MRDAIRKERKKMYGYEATVLFMVGKVMDAEKLATAKRERFLNEQSRTRRPKHSN
jgi:hypothetical protein